jgi:phosphatidylserine/phosphatidylglycerophosphate/cardiolipin synthase-like enzyme
VAKKSRLFIASLLLAALYAFLIRAALCPSLPSPHQPLLFYSNQKRDDLRLVLKRAFKQAQKSIDITMYAITDPELLLQLEKKSQQGTAIHLFHDRHNTPSTSLSATPIKTKGLMHRKIVVIDNSQIFLGSANLTTSSLLLHDNLTLGFYHPALAHFLQNPYPPSFHFTIDNQPAEIWLLPAPGALEALLKALQNARSSIFVAMFTLTHPDLLQALVDAQRRGITVTVALDRYAARGASKKAVDFLRFHHIPLLFSQGLQLLHHKWAYIDRSSLILGSTNWTKAAFTKNQDCLLFLHHLNIKQLKLFDRLCDTIQSESGDSL